MAFRRVARVVTAFGVRHGVSASGARTRVAAPVAVPATALAAGVGVAAMSLWAQPSDVAGSPRPGSSALYRYRPEPSCEVAQELRRHFVTLLPPQLQEKLTGKGDHGHSDSEDLGLFVGPAPPGEDPRLTQVLEFWFRGDPSMWCDFTQLFAGPAQRVVSRLYAHLARLRAAYNNRCRFRKDPELDLSIKQTFSSLMKEAQEGRLTELATTPRQALAIVRSAGVRGYSCRVCHVTLGSTCLSFLSAHAGCAAGPVQSQRVPRFAQGVRF